MCRCATILNICGFLRLSRMIPELVLYRSIIGIIYKTGADIMKRNNTYQEISMREADLGYPVNCSFASSRLSHDCHIRAPFKTNTSISSIRTRWATTCIIRLWPTALLWGGARQMKLRLNLLNIKPEVFHEKSTHSR
jgi:hypothetical protein